MFQPIDFICKTVWSVQYIIFDLYVFHQCLNNSLTHFGYNLTLCLEIWKRYCRRVYESLVAKNRNVTANLSWTGIAARNLVSLFTIFGPTKLISSSKTAGANRVNFLYRPLNSWHFKPTNKLVPLYTDLFLYNSVCHQRLSRRFLLLDNMWCTNTRAALATCKDYIFPPGAAKTGGSQRAARSPECVPSCPNLKPGAIKTPCDVTLLRCGRMLKSQRALTRGQECTSKIWNSLQWISAHMAIQQIGYNLNLARFLMNLPCKIWDFSCNNTTMRGALARH